MAGRRRVQGDDAQTARPAIRTLYMSGYAHPVLASQGTLETGVTLIEKPFTEPALLDKIKKENPTDPSTYFFLGSLAYEAKNYEKAAEQAALPLPAEAAKISAWEAAN